MSIDKEKLGDSVVSEMAVNDYDNLRAEGHLKQTIRGLKPRHIQVMAISGAIGTGLFVGTGSTLHKAGPLSLLLSYVLFSFITWITFRGMGAMVSQLPVDGGFLYFAKRYVSPSFGFALGWLYVYNGAALVAAEVAAIAALINFWNDTINNAAWCALIIVIFFALNTIGVRVFGEGEFWLSIGKLILVFALMLFTLITMAGGNPQHDAFGFRYWKSGPVMNEYVATGSLGRFLGFWSCMTTAAYTFGGPEWVSFTAGEAMSPRRVLPSVFKRVIFRLLFFYIGGVLCVTILMPSSDPDLGKSLPGAGSSPFVLASVRLGIPIFPHVLNAVIFTSAFSCGLELSFAASRGLYGLALEGSAPRIFTRTARGVPVYCVIVVCAIACLSFMSASTSSSEAFNWIVNLTGSALLLIYGLMNYIYVRWYKANKAQDKDMSKMPRGQLYLCYIGMFVYLLMWITNGFAVFVNGGWSVRDFFFAYFAIVVFVVAYVTHSVFKSHTFKEPPLEEVDVTSGIAAFDEMEANEPPLENTRLARFNRWLWG